MSDEFKRQQAEARLLQKSAKTPENMAALSPAAVEQMMHELRVHQIELEMQNEELRESQLALDQVRARYFELYDMAPIGYCAISATGMITEANLTVARMLGVSRDALIRKPFSRHIFKSDQDLYYLHCKKLLAGGEPLSCELRMVKADGSQLWVHLAATSTHNAEGVPELRAVISDVNARKQAEASRISSEARLHGLIDSVLDAIIAIDADHHIIMFNPAAERMFGHSAAEVVGSSLERLIPERFHSAHGELIRGYAATRISSRVMGQAGRISGLRADGVEFPVDASISQIEYAGKPMFTVILRDVSERDRLYQDLQEKNLALESARATAEKANRAKSEFLSNMSHELRTPLGAILGFAQLLDSGSNPPTMLEKRSIDQILKAGWYLLELINEILDLALIESGKLALSMEPVSLADIMLECQTMTESQAQHRSIKMRFPHVDVLGFVHADSTRLKQVLLNLLSNAIKYNKTEGMIDVVCIECAPERIRISIKDTGHGLSPEKLAQLFQPFNRLGQETSVVQGTGIGLVMAKCLVELMQGDIGVESTVGQGSEFWIELNRSNAPSHFAVEETNTVADIAQAEAELPLRKLLYIEDNPANMMLVEVLLSRRPDISLLSAVDGYQGIKLAVENLPSVILLDINLPGISGLQVREILANNVATRHIPVVALSANAMRHDIRKGLEAGFFAYLTKPIKLAEFMETLDAALQYADTHSAAEH